MMGCAKVGRSISTKHVEATFRSHSLHDRNEDEDEDGEAEEGASDSAPPPLW